MVSERMQRRIDRLLDPAEEAANQVDLDFLRDCADQALTLDPEIADGFALPADAERTLEVIDSGGPFNVSSRDSRAVNALDYPASEVFAGREREMVELCCVPDEALSGYVRPAMLAREGAAGGLGRVECVFQPGSELA